MLIVDFELLDYIDCLKIWDKYGYEGIDCCKLYLKKELSTKQRLYKLLYKDITKEMYILKIKTELNKKNKYRVMQLKRLCGERH